MAPVALTIHDIKGNVLSANESFMRLTGLSRDAIIGKSLSSLARNSGISDEKFLGIRQKFLTLINEGKVEPFEYALRKKVER